MQCPPFFRDISESWMDTEGCDGVGDGLTMEDITYEQVLIYTQNPTGINCQLEQRL